MSWFPERRLLWQGLGADMMGTRCSAAFAASAIFVLASASTGSPAVVGVPGAHSSSAVEIAMNAPDVGVAQGARHIESERADPLNHAGWGLFSNPGTAQDGMIAVHTVYPDLGIGIQHGESLYAPTMKPPNSCIEMTTAYGKPAGAELWAWDWCPKPGEQPGPGKWAVLSDPSDPFLSKYTKRAPSGNGRAYLVRIKRTDAATNTWWASLFNYQTAVWDPWYTSSGQPQNAQPSLGWDAFEAYSTVDPQTGDGYYCASLANTRFDSINIRLLDGNSNVAATSANSSYLSAGESPFFCPRLSFNTADSYNSWTVFGGP
ncbi:hypothetical protein AB0L41_34865 [Amycolatopsis mediterranei]|uniref:hypothetical protein n=1 Tax=Amycolatopsis mediterranei TaxID=33910 RepID=UPI003425C246